MTKARRYVTKAQSFWNSYTKGIDSQGFRHLFGRDASEAYRVLARDHGEEPEPKDDVARFIHRAKVLFLAVSERLSPPRRALFAIAVIATAIGLFWPTEVHLDIANAYIAFDFSPLWFLVAIGSFAYLLLFELVDRIRFRDELEIARQLQRDLMPQVAPKVPGYSFAHSYRTATAVGGDYYDFQPLTDGRLAIVIGDASGHGIGAGLLMAIAHSTWRTALDIDPDPLSVARLLNRTLFRSGDTRAFMTLLYGVLDPLSGELEIVCAGHPYPVVRRAAGQVEEFGSGSLPLGLRESLELEPQSIVLEPGDTLLLYTDGLAESVGETSGEAFGFAKIRELMQQPAPPVEIHDRIVTAFSLHQGTGHLADDVTLLVVARDSMCFEASGPGARVTPEDLHPPN